MKPSKSGRPKLPDGTANTVLFAVKIPANEADKVNKAIKQSGVSKPDWARGAIMSKARQQVIWVTSKKWNAEDLNKKTVQFEIRAVDYGHVKGNGIIYAWARTDGAMQVRIESRYKYEKTEFATTNFFITQDIIDLFEKQPDGAPFDFSFRFLPSQK